MGKGKYSIAKGLEKAGKWAAVTALGGVAVATQSGQLNVETATTAATAALATGLAKLLLNWLRNR